MADAEELSRITTLAQLDSLLTLSRERPIWLFKHSLICPTSDAAWREFGRFAAGRLDSAVVGVIEIQRARDVSKAVESHAGVRHESPQVLLIRDGRPLWHSSHWSITVEALEEAADSIASFETADPASLIGSR